MRKECPNTNYPSGNWNRVSSRAGWLNVKGAQAKTRIIVEGLKM